MCPSGATHLPEDWCVSNLVGPINRVGLVQSGHQHHFIECNLFLSWIQLKGARVAQWVRLLDRTVHTSLSPIRRGFTPSFVNYKKGCTQLAAASDKVYQLLAHGQWFFPASSTTKTGRHDIHCSWNIAKSGNKIPKIKFKSFIAEILLKVALKHNKSNKIIK